MQRYLWAVVLVLALWPAGCDKDAPAPESPIAATVAPEPPAVAAPVPSETPAPILRGGGTTIVGGVAARPLDVGSARPLPDGIAVIAVTGCWQCDGPPTGLLRVYRDQNGVTRADTLIRRTEGGRGEPYISGVAIAPDASDIALSLCVRGYCGGVAGPTDDARTVVLRSRDGGVTWTELAALDGARYVVAVVRDGVILGPFIPYSEPVPAPGYVRYPGGQPVSSPAGFRAGHPLALAGGELGWYSDDGPRILTEDGRVALDLAPLGVGNAGVTPSPDSDRFAVAWFSETARQPPSAGQPRFFLGVLGPDGRASSVVVSMAGFIRAGVWLDQRRVLGNVVLDDGPPELAEVGYVPALIDIESGRAEPIPEGFERGRNQIVAVMRGPFVRVRDMGDCLQIRAQPSRDAAPVDCAAAGVLLRDTGELRQDGDLWLKVVTTAGREGWASATYLER